MFTHFKRLIWKASLLTTAISLVFTTALAAPGDLDPTFSGGGVFTDVNAANPGRDDLLKGIAIQTNGKILAAGFNFLPSTPTTSDFAITRYNTNGSLDTAFSADGKLLTNFGGIDQGSDIAVQSNGKIVVAGQKCNATSGLCDLAIARYNGGGSLDTTFNTDGKVVTTFGSGDNGSLGGLAIQSNGRIVVAGYVQTATSYDFAVHRYLSNGTPDTSFSGDGRVNIGFGAGRNDIGFDLVLQSDGKIVIAGQSCDASDANCNFAVARLNANGTLDTTFSGDGRVTTNFGVNEYAYSVALQSNGKIVLAGTKVTATLSSFAIARYNTNGSPDTTFNTTGRRAFNLIPGADASAEDVVVQSNGKIVILGDTDNGSGALDIALVRLNSTGSFDATFVGGWATFNAGGDESGTALALQPSDGKYVLGGDADDGTQSDFTLLRVLP